MSDASANNQRVILDAVHQIGRLINQIDTRVSTVDNQVKQINSEVTSIDTRLENLTTEFQNYLQRYERATELQLAETRIIKVRQEIGTKFGHYSDVRRRTTGILQATDVGIVRQETVTTATEELMLSAPRYWLAPCLVTLAAWLSDNKPTAEQALEEGLKRDPAKVSLFFALVSRRLGRGSLSGSWLERYFALLNPVDLDREVVVLIDAISSGAFGIESRLICARSLASWLDILAERPGFLEEQRNRWGAALRSVKTSVSSDRYEYLSKFSQTWPQLVTSLAGARVHGAIVDHFTSTFSSVTTTSPDIVVAVDDLLDKLVSRFDDEELPLRREERVLDLIIEEQGDKVEAERRADLEKEALATKVNFTQLLTNAAMHPETSHASLETQRYAIVLSKDWIVQAHDDLTAENRALMPLSITFSMEGWSGTTQSGADEAQLLTSLRTHLDGRMQAELEKIKVGPLHIGALALGSAILLFGAISVNVFLMIFGLCGVLYFFFSRMQMEPNRQKIRDYFASLQEKCADDMRGVCAEVVEWRRAYAAADGRATEVRALLSDLRPDQYLPNMFESARVIVK